MSGNDWTFYKDFFNEELYLIKENAPLNAPGAKKIQAGSKPKEEAPAKPVAETPATPAAETPAIDKTPEPGPAPEPETATPAPKVDILGNADSKVLLLMQYAEDKIPLEEKKLLERILNAVGTSLTSIAWVNIFRHEGISWEEIKTESKATVVIAFGTAGQYLPEGTEEGVAKGSGDKKVLLTDTLEVLQADQDKKKTLWTALQKVFSL